MAHIKIEMGKMDSTWGTVELLESGDFVFEGPKAKAMREFMEEVAALRRVQGEQALQAFMKAFSHGSYWFSEVSV